MVLGSVRRVCGAGRVVGAQFHDGLAGDSEPELRRLAAHEGGEVTGNDESAFMVDHGMHVLTHVLDDFRPGTGDLVLPHGLPALDRRHDPAAGPARGTHR